MTNRLILFFIVGCILIGCSQTDKKIQKDKVVKFENHFGKERAILLNEMVEIFDKLLLEEYNCQTQILDCYISFLKDVQDQKKIEFINVPEKERIRLKARIDSTGFRKDIWIFEYEKKQDSTFLDDDIPVTIQEGFSDSLWNASQDSTVENNINGYFLTGLELIQENDSLIIGYVDDLKSANVLSPTISSRGLLYAINNYEINEYFFKRIVVAEYFVLFFED